MKSDGYLSSFRLLCPFLVIETYQKRKQLKMDQALEIIVPDEGIKKGILAPCR